MVKRSIMTHSMICSPHCSRNSPQSKMKMAIKTNRVEQIELDLRFPRQEAPAAPRRRRKDNSVEENQQPEFMPYPDAGSSHDLGWGFKRTAYQEKRLDGSYVGGDFRGVNFDGSVLSGDFTNADFTGARVSWCRLVGIFEKTRGLGRAIQDDSQIEASASFKGADLCGVNCIFRNAAQLEGARVHWFDSVHIETGKRTFLTGKGFYVPHLPAQIVPGLVLQGSPFGAASGIVPRLHILALQYPPSRCLGYHSMCDLAGLGGIEIWGDELPSGTDALYYEKVKQPHFPLCLNAKGVTFRNLAANRGHYVLHGVYDNARFIACGGLGLDFASGSFRDIDLTGLEGGDVAANLGRVDIRNLTFPVAPVQVRLRWSSRRPLACRTDAAHAQVVIDAWYSAGKCDALAHYIFQTEYPKLTPQNKALAAKLLNSRGKTLEGMDERLPQLPDALNAIAGLITRRNHLKSQVRSRRALISTIPAGSLPVSP
jgi:hypothetical protein